jgi:hypothetical protein
MEEGEGTARRRSAVATARRQAACLRQGFGGPGCLPYNSGGVAKKVKLQNEAKFRGYPDLLHC